MTTSEISTPSSMHELLSLLREHGASALKNRPIELMTQPMQRHDLFAFGIEPNPQGRTRTMEFFRVGDAPEALRNPGTNDYFYLIVEHIVQPRGVTDDVLEDTLRIGGRIMSFSRHPSLWVMGSYNVQTGRGRFRFYDACPYINMSDMETHNRAPIMSDVHHILGVPSHHMLVKMAGGSSRTDLFAFGWEPCVMGNIRTAQFGYDSGQGEPFGIVMEYVLQLRNPSGSMLVGTVFIGGRVQNPVDYAPMWALGAYDQLLDSGAIFFYKQCPYRLPELVA